MINFNCSEYYSSKSALLFYSNLTTIGLYDFEEKIFEKSEPAKTCLVIGCGTGREALALEKKGLEVTGIDLCREQILSAKAIAESLKSKSRFLHTDVFGLDERESFDLVWLTSGITGHMATTSRRTYFFKLLNQMANQLVYLPTIMPPPWSEEQIRQSYELKKNYQDFESGDTLRSQFGPIEPSAQLYFYHYYLSHFDAEKEAINAGWKTLDYTEDGLVFSK